MVCSVHAQILIMTSEANDHSFVIKMLEDFRSEKSKRRVSSRSSLIQPCGSNEDVNIMNRISTEPASDSSTFFKTNATPTSVEPTEKRKRSVSPIGSPWECHRMRSQLFDANMKISDLENQISRHHSLRVEMELLFKKERESLQKQVDSEKSLIKELEHHLQEVRKREMDVKEELRQCKITLNRDKMNFEDRLQNLQKENAKLADSLQDMERSIQSERTVSTRHIQHVRDELSEKDQELIELRKRISDLEQRVHEGLLVQNEVEHLTQDLQNAKMKIKELERERDDHLEAAELAKSQQEKIFRYSELEKELADLREDNTNLKKLVPKHLVLEEMVQDLKARQITYDQQAEDLAWAQGQVSHLQASLDEWHSVAQDYCKGYMSSSLPPDPSVIRKRFNGLLQQVHVLTADVSEAKSQLNEALQKKEHLSLEVQTAKKEAQKFQNINEQHNNRMRLLQRKLQFVTTERDSYRLQLDSYEKDMTISASNLGNLQYQQLQQKLDHNEKTLDNYRRMLEKIEAENDHSKGLSGNANLQEKLYRLEKEYAALLQEKEQIQKRKDELEIQMEYRAIKGDFNPVTSKIFHFRNNPRAEAEAQFEDEVTKLRAKCARLEERIKLLEEGNINDITQKVEENVASSNSQEVEELKEAINAQELKMQRLKEVFHAAAKEFREVCYELFGFRIDRNENVYKLSSMYAESEDDFLMFKRLSDGSIDMMETTFSATLGELINIHLHHHNSPPLFLGAVTVELFNRQMLTHTISETIELN